MNNVTWKAHEREVAKFFGTKRVPLSGINSGHNTHSDSLDEILYIESKHRSKTKNSKGLNSDLPIIKRYEKVKLHAKEYGLIPMVIISSMPYHIAVFHSSDIKKIISPSVQNLKKIVQPKKDALLTLFKETYVKAYKEGKVPLIALKQKRMKGFLIACSVNDINMIQSVREERGLV